MLMMLCYLLQLQELHQKKILDQHGPRVAFPLASSNFWLVVCLFSLPFAQVRCHRYLASDSQNSFSPALV